MKKKIRVTSQGWKKIYELAVELDFTGCSEEQLKEWASRERIIALQRTLRTRGEDYVASLQGTLNIKAAEIGAEKAPVEVIVQRLTDEEKQKLLALLQQT